MRRLKFTLSYDGTHYFGWQIQPHLPTIQGALEAVLAQIEGAPVKVTGSGRTDAGVHALAQVAACDLRNPIPPANLRKALNRLLPPDIRVLAVEQVHPSFHPRRDALAKTYEYRIWREEVCPPFERLYCYHYPYPLNLAVMGAIAPYLAGTHDFSAFAAADEKDSLGASKVRTIFSSELRLDGPRLLYRVRGSGFLKHMVRNIVGFLLEAGKGNVTPARLAAALTPGYPHKAGPTVPPQGLFLISVEYPC